MALRLTGNFTLQHGHLSAPYSLVQCSVKGTENSQPHLDTGAHEVARDASRMETAVLATCVRTPVGTGTNMQAVHMQAPLSIDRQNVPKPLFTFCFRSCAMSDISSRIAGGPFRGPSWSFLAPFEKARCSDLPCTQQERKSDDAWRSPR